MAPFLEALNGECVQVLGWTLLHFVWQGAIVGMLAWALHLTLKRASSNARYTGYLVLFSTLMVCPVATFIVLTPQVSDIEVVSDPAPLNVPAAASPSFVRSADVAAGIDLNASDLTESDFANSISLHRLDDEALPPNIAKFVNPHQRANDASTDQLSYALSWIVFGWCLGVVLLAARLARTWWLVRRLVRVNVRPLSETWMEKSQLLSYKLGIRRAIVFLESGLTRVPAVVGWLKPVVLLPTAVLGNLTASEVEALIIHELAHIRRRDSLVNLIQAIAETLLFYHPVVWMLSNRIRIEREHCCDDIAIDVVGDRVQYSKALIAAAELAVAPHQRRQQLTVASDGGDFVNRIRRVLGKQDSSDNRVNWFSFLATVSCAVFAVITAVAICVNSSNADTPTPVDESVLQDSNDDDKQVVNSPLAASSGALLSRMGNDRYASGIEHVRFVDNKSLVVAVRGTAMFASPVAEKARPAAIMDAHTGKIIRRFGPIATEDNVWSVLAISGDGKRIAFRKDLTAKARNRYWGIWSSVADVEIYDTQTEKRITTLKQTLGGNHNSVAINYDGSRMVFCGGGSFGPRERKIEIWNSKTGKRLKTRAVPNRGNVDAVAIDYQGDEIAIGTNFEIYTWRWNAKPAEEPKVIDEHGATAVAYSPDGKFFASGRGGSPGARLRDRTSRKKLYQFPVGGSLTVAFSPDSSLYIVPSGYHRTIDIQDVKTGKRLHRIKTDGPQIENVAVSPDGKLLAVAGHNPGVGIFDLKTAKKLSQNGSGHDESVRDLRFSPDGKSLLTGGMDGRVVLWDAFTGKIKRVLLKSSNHWAGGVNFSADGKHVAAATLSGQNYLWETGSGKLARKLPGHGTTGAVYPVVVTPKGQIVSFGPDQHLRAYDANSGKLVLDHVIDANDPGRHGHAHQKSKISADGSSLLVSSGKSLRIYDVSTGNERATIARVGAGFDVSPDGKIVATSQKLFDSHTGEQVGSIAVNGGRNQDVRFSQDGRWIAIVTASTGGSTSHRMWLYDRDTSTTLLHSGLEIHPYAIAPSPDGNRVAVACADNSVLVFNVAHFAQVGGIANVNEGQRIFKFLKSDEKLKRIAGRVVGPNGRPVSGAEVLLREMPLGNEVRESFLGFDKTVDIARLWTDSHGRFEFKDVPSLGANPRKAYRKDGVRYDILATPFYPNEKPKQSLAATWRHVRDGDNVELKLGKGAVLNGRVTDLDGKPLAKVAIVVRFFMPVNDVMHSTLSGLDWPDFLDDSFLSLKAATRGGVVTHTDNDGRYSLVNLPQNSGIVLEAIHDSYTRQFFYAATVEKLNPMEGQRRRRQVHVGEANLKLDPGHQISAKVIYGDSGHLAVGAPVSFVDFRNRKVTKLTDKNGVVEVNAIPSGLLSISANPPAGDNQTQKTDRYAAGRKRLFLNRNERKHEIEIKLLRPAELAVQNSIDEFLDRLENVGPELPPRRPRNYVVNPNGEVVELRLNKSENLKRSDFAIIGEMQTLEKLSLQRSIVSNKDLLHLAGLENLKHLDLGWNKQIGNGLVLAKLPKLETLNLRLTSTVDADLKFLKSIPSLRRLNIADTNISDAGLKMIADMNLDVEVLNLIDCEITDIGLQHLKSMKKLRGIMLRETLVTDAGLRTFAARPPLLKRPRFDWIVTPRLTVQELIRRIEKGEHSRVLEMCGPGITLPTTGVFKLSELIAHVVDEHDRKLNRQKFRIEFAWKHEGRADCILHVEVRVERGTVTMVEAGIDK